MPVKFDKEMLIKHRFWVLLGISVPLVLVAVFILITSVSADIESSRKKLADKYKAAQANAQVGPRVIEVHTKEAEVWKQQETKVHEIAFKAQDSLFTWPDAVEERFDFQHGWFATDIKIIPAPTGDPPADAEDLCHGKVVRIDPDSVVIAGKEKKEARFYATLKVKVTKQDKKENEKDQWATIQPGDWLAITYYKSKYFYDPLTINEQNEFARSYKSQLDAILHIVDPVNAKGVGTVQFNGWPYREGDLPPPHSKFFTYVDKEWNVEGFIYDEAWMAQEDLWIQRELFRLIRVANDSVAKCIYQRDAKEDPTKPVPPARFEDKTKPITFANPNFELKFEWLGDGKLAVTAKNLLPRRQKLDVNFRVKFNKSPNQELSSEPILIDGEPLDPKGIGKDSFRKEIPLEKGRVQRTGIYAVEQILTWETAPVKRIDHVAIGSATSEIAHSHKTFPQGSQPYRKEEKKEDAAKDANPMGGLGVPPGVGGGAGKEGMMAFGGGGAAGQGQANVGINGVLKDRYLEVSDQSRRLPVGLALIVDQDHIGRVLTSFNNSKLRFLTTQVLLNRYPNSVRPNVAGTGGEAGEPKEFEQPPMPMFQPMGVLMPGVGSGPRGGGSSPPTGGLGAPPGLAAGGFPGMLAGGAPGIPSAGNTGGSEELENNLELVIYGIVTLYERYPKRKMDVK